MKRDLLLGLSLIAITFVLLPALLDTAGDREELSVRLPGPRPFLLEPGGDEPPSPREPAGVVVRPVHILGELEESGTRDRQGPGISFLRWQRTYGARWERRVDLPVLRGPFHPSDRRWPCALALILRPSFFDAGGDDDVASLIDEEVRLAFPIVYDDMVPEIVKRALDLPAVDRTRIELELEEGFLRAKAELFFVNGAQVALSARLAFSEHDGQLVATPQRVQMLRWTGAEGASWLESIVGSVARKVGRGIAEDLVRDSITETLAPLQLPRPQPLFEGRADDRIGVELCGPPRVDAQGLVLPLSVVAALSPQTDDLVPGPTYVGGEIRIPDVASPERLELVIGPEGLNQALYIAWQSGVLDRFARESDIGSRLEAELEGRLRASFGEVALGLPPVLTPPHATDGWMVRLADAALGEADGRELVAHADLRVRPVARAGTIGFEASFADAHLNCTTREGDGFVLSPCLSDVIPLVRTDASFAQEREFLLDPEVLRQITRFAFAGHEILLSRIDMDPPDAAEQLRVTAHAQIRPL